MKNYIVYLLVMIVVICGCPVPSSAAEEPKLYAKAAVLTDADTGRVLYGRAPDEALPMASTTKIMTLILALEYGNPDDVVTVSSYAAKMPEVRLGLHAGDRYVLQDLLYSMMLESHNDSACAVAEQVGGSVEAFAQMMNRKAAEIGLHDTYFITPNGLDAEDAVGVHSTTAEDLAKLMRYCVFVSEEKEEFQEICQTRQYTFASCDGTRQFTVYNKNALLDQMDGVLAGKTGFTGNAGYCYVAAVNVGEKHFIVALLAAGRTTSITNGQIRELCLHMAMQTMNTGKSNLQGCIFLLFRSQKAWNRLFPVHVRGSLPFCFLTRRRYSSGLYRKAD